MFITSQGVLYLTKEYTNRLTPLHTSVKRKKRESSLFNKRHISHGKPSRTKTPLTAAIKLPLGPNGVTGSAAFAAFAADPSKRPATAP